MTYSQQKNIIKYTITLIIIAICSNIYTLNAQKINKGIKYYNEKNYNKALNIFDKTITYEKFYTPSKYYKALILSNTKYEKNNFYYAYKYIKTVNEKYQKFPIEIKYSYAKKYGITQKKIDSITSYIINNELEKAISNPRIDIWNTFISLYQGSTQAAKLENLRDSLIFENVKDDGSLFAYQQFITNYPKSTYKKQAEQQKIKIWKQKYNEAYKELDLNAIKQFKKIYPNYPYYNDSTQKYTNLAIKASNLKLHLGFMEANKPYYIEFIKQAAPKEIAFQTLLCLIQPYLENKDRKNAINTIEKYKKYFKNSYKIDSLIAILNRKEKKIQNHNLSTNINTKHYEYMPVITPDDSTIYFCAQERPENIGGEDVFVSNLQKNGWSKPTMISSLSTPTGNEAPLSIAPDQSSMIMFANGNVYTSKKTKEGWSYRQPITKINTVKYWEADAYISPDGNAIFFSSDRANGIGPFRKFSQQYHGDYLGNLDLYVIIKKNNGNWSDPINLGKTINTPYAERTPFLHPDMKTLYFSSDGHPGIGKMDVFKTTRINDTSWTEWTQPINLGLEINTPKKEYGYKISTDGTKAYYTQFVDNQSDIYYTTLPDNIRPNQVAILKGHITDKNNKPLDAEIIWENLQTFDKLGKLKSNQETGEYTITLPLNKNYGIYISKKGYYPKSENINLLKLTKNTTIRKNFKLDNIETIIKGQTTIKLQNVFFDTDKYELKTTSFPELMRLAKFIKKYPNIIIEISGHTDNTGKEKYNENLSQKRADAVKKYLIKNDCNPKQLKSTGYGNTKPIADNSTSTGRQKNRRVEFIVIKN